MAAADLPATLLQMRRLTGRTGARARGISGKTPGHRRPVQRRMAAAPRETHKRTHYLSFGVVTHKLLAELENDGQRTRSLKICLLICAVPACAARRIEQFQKSFGIRACPELFCSSPHRKWCRRREIVSGEETAPLHLLLSRRTAVGGMPRLGRAGFPGLESPRPVRGGAFSGRVLHMLQSCCFLPSMPPGTNCRKAALQIWRLTMRCENELTMWSMRQAVSIQLIKILRGPRLLLGWVANTSSRLSSCADDIRELQQRITDGAPLAVTSRWRCRAQPHPMCVTS